MLISSQTQILKLAGLNHSQLTHKQLTEIVNQLNCSRLTDKQLIEFLEIANALYRGGEVLIPDHVYDSVFLAELKKENLKEKGSGKRRGQSPFKERKFMLSFNLALN